MLLCLVFPDHVFHFSTYTVACGDMVEMMVSFSYFWRKLPIAVGGASGGTRTRKPLVDGPKMVL
jgi:hypothetical protein